MAKPIEPTPVLKGKDAEKFIRLTGETERSPDKARAAFLTDCFMLFSAHKF